MVRHVVKNKHQNMCCDEIGLYAQNTDTILGSIINTTGRAYVNILRERESTF